MTSKEALENIIKFLQELEDNSILPIPAFSKYLKEIKVINKDLEILELFKKHTERNGEDVIMILNAHGYYDRECLKIVKWLEREKRNEHDNR